MLNDPRSHGLWEKTAPQPPRTSALEGVAEADVVIVNNGPVEPAVHRFLAAVSGSPAARAGS